MSMLTVIWALVSIFGTDTQDIAALRLSCTMVKLCASPSLGMDTNPGTRKVAPMFPFDVTDVVLNGIDAGTGTITGAAAS